MLFEPGVRICWYQWDADEIYAGVVERVMAEEGVLFVREDGTGWARRVDTVMAGVYFDTPANRQELASRVEIWRARERERVDCVERQLREKMMKDHADEHADSTSGETYQTYRVVQGVNVYICSPDGAVVQLLLLDTQQLGDITEVPQRVDIAGFHAVFGQLFAGQNIPLDLCRWWDWRKDEHGADACSLHKMRESLLIRAGVSLLRTQPPGTDGVAGWLAVGEWLTGGQAVDILRAAAHGTGPWGPDE